MSKELLWLYAPDFNENGVMSSIKTINNIRYDFDEKVISSEDSIFWKQNEECAGFVISENHCEYRTKEMILVTYTPLECLSGEIENCEDLIAYARYNNQKAVRDEAFLQLQKTLFTCVLMSIGSIMFTNDTDYIIIAPITKMVSIIKQLADDPL